MQSPITASSRIIIATHELFYGASQALRDYLNSRNAKEVVFISHPILPENPQSYKHVFKKGVVVREKTLTRSSGNLLWYVVDAGLTFFWVVGEKGFFDVYVGVDPLNCAVGLFLKALGVVRKVVFYSIDFVPRRFTNRLLDTAYHEIEILCVRFSDARWDVSPRIAEGREKFLHLSAKTFSTRIVPIGVWEKDIVTRESRFDPHRFVFAGHLLSKQGVGKVLEAIPSVLKKVQDVTFLIIGGGEEEGWLRDLVRKLGIANHVTFTGWIKDQNEIRKLFARCAFAVATYDPRGADEGNFTYYADPTKIKTYLSCGLPVVMTDVSYNAKDLEQAGCVTVVPYDTKAIARALMVWLIDRKALAKARGNATEIAKTFTWERIFKTPRHE